MLIATLSMRSSATAEELLATLWSDSAGGQITLIGTLARLFLTHSGNCTKSLCAHLIYHPAAFPLSLQRSLSGFGMRKKPVSAI